MNTFEAAALSAFEFLTREFGYEATSRNNAVSYRRGRYQVVVQYDSRKSYELTVDLGNKGQEDTLFNLGEALRSCAASTQVASAYQVSKPESISKFLELLAAKLKQHCGALLRGDELAWSRLEAQRKAECTAFSNQRELRHARDGASQAWEAEDYRRVVQILTPLESSLSRAEQFKLELAKKRM